MIIYYPGKNFLQLDGIPRHRKGGFDMRLAPFKVPAFGRVGKYHDRVEDENLENFRVYVLDDLLLDAALQHVDQGIEITLHGV